MIQIIPIGGYREVGKNCTAIKVDDEVVILDMGLHLQNYIDYTDEEDVDFSTEKLIEMKAIPDLSPIEKLLPLVKGICISHAHLDHVGAVPFLEYKFHCPFYGTPYTIEVLKSLLNDHSPNRDFKNRLIVKEPNSVFKISEKIKIEFISVTHSIVHTAVIAVHTKYGTIVYANDFKLDTQPTLGMKSNLGRLKELKNVKLLIMDSLYASKPIKTPSESVAKELLREVLLSTNSEGKAIVISTFSSHLARLKSIIEFSKPLKRKVVFLGRSLDRYITAAEKLKIIDFSSQAKLIKYKNEVQSFLKNCKNPQDFIFVVTGHQGESKSVLGRMVFNKYFNFNKEDIMIFSSNIIPGKKNIEAREKIESELKKKKVRIFRDIHVSGHGAREDQRDLINMIKPENLVPTHSESKVCDSFVELAEEMGYRENKNIFVIKNGSSLYIK